MKKIFFVLAILTAIAFSSCANLLVSNPSGSTVSEEQLQKSIRELDARVNGLYYAMNSLTSYLGAQKYIDVYTDVLASDVGLQPGASSMQPSRGEVKTKQLVSTV